ncbi:hypothetical protein [Candidatus Avelusimicrobium fimicolum]|uniref:hypothetical protein n=1 Tax=Candidatus Avelusimicrobium fimicolum TaxID=3416216 RepID=UPI003D139419
MSNCCKCAKWFPHNWLCLKGLSVLFLVLFYLALVYAVFQAYAIFSHPQLSGSEMWLAAAFYVASDLAAAVGFLTVAKVLKVLRKIKNAVAPCCCSHEAPAEEEHIADVVEEESK